MRRLLARGPRSRLVAARRASRSSGSSARRVPRSCPTARSRSRPRCQRRGRAGRRRRRHLLRRRPRAQAIAARALVPSLRPDGADLVPEDAIVPPGTTTSDRAVGLRQMARSEEVAAAVALREARLRRQGRAGRRARRGVVARRAGRRRARADRRDRRRDGSRSRRPATCARSRSASRRQGALALRGGHAAPSAVRTVADPDDPGRAVIGDRGSGSRPTSSCRSRSTSTSATSAARRPGLAFALDVMEELGRDVDRGYNGWRPPARSSSTAGSSRSAAQAEGDRRAACGCGCLPCPAGDNAREARSADAGLRIIPVDTFQQALRALATLPERVVCGRFRPIESGGNCSVFVDGRRLKWYPGRGQNGPVSEGTSKHRSRGR